MLLLWTALNNEQWHVAEGLQLVLQLRSYAAYRQHSKTGSVANVLHHPADCCIFLQNPVKHLQLAALLCLFHRAGSSMSCCQWLHLTIHSVALLQATRQIWWWPIVCTSITCKIPRCGCKMGCGVGCNQQGWQHVSTRAVGNRCSHMYNIGFTKGECTTAHLQAMLTQHDVHMQYMAFSKQRCSAKDLCWGSCPLCCTAVQQRPLQHSPASEHVSAHTRIAVQLRLTHHMG